MVRTASSRWQIIKPCNAIYAGKAPSTPENAATKTGVFLSVRVPGVLTLAATLTAGVANASSFAFTGDALPATPSIVMLGASAVATTHLASIPTMPSIIAMGEPFPAVTNEKVAAIPSKRRHGPAFEPLVIRGGIAGNAFVLAKPADKAAKPTTIAEPEQQASAPQNEAPDQAAAPSAPPARLPPNGYGKHRSM
jgi:hypothetical protein